MSTGVFPLPPITSWKTGTINPIIPPIFCPLCVFFHYNHSRIGIVFYIHVHITQHKRSQTMLKAWGCTAIVTTWFQGFNSGAPALQCCQRRYCELPLPTVRRQALTNLQYFSLFCYVLISHFSLLNGLASSLADYNYLDCPSSPKHLWSLQFKSLCYSLQNLLKIESKTNGKHKCFIDYMHVFKK